tara:strand:- start:846 stop:2096 length:1251 start_codon:yes stop_codon:yes gene_type:complete
MAKQTLFTTDREQYDAFIAAGGDPADATFVDTSSAETLDAFYESYGDVPNLEGADVEEPDSDWGSRNPNWGSRIGTEGPWTTDVVDTDGDGVDDRWQEGPGKPQQRQVFDPSVDETPSFETTEEFKTLKSGFLGELTRIGLDTNTIGSLWDWVEERFVADDAFTSAQAMVEIYDQEAFKRRFPGITTMREDVGRRDIPTPGEYLQREKWITQKFEEYGLTPLQAKLDNVVAESFINTIGTGELDERMTAASEMIYQAPEAIKDTFGEWYGPHSNAALMAAFLDPDDTIFGGNWKNWTVLKGDVAAAEVGGWSKMLLDLESPVSHSRAERISKLGLSEREIWSKFGALKEQEDLFSERLGETVDLDLATGGVEAQFGLSQDTADLLRRRREQRAAEFQGAGGALMSGSTTGFGAVNA